MPSLARWPPQKIASTDNIILRHCNMLIISIINMLFIHHTTTTPQPFYGPIPGPPGWAGARREVVDFVVQGKINRGRHTDHPAGRHSIRTNQCLPPPYPHFLPAGFPSCRPTNSVKALAHSDSGEDARVLLNGVTCTVSVPWCYLFTVNVFPFTLCCLLM